MVPGYGLSCLISTFNILIFFLFENSFIASSSNSGAIITSTNCLEFISFAVAKPTFLLRAIIPPKADVGSVLKAKS